MKRKIFVILLIAGFLFTFTNLSQGWCPVRNPNIIDRDLEGRPHQDDASIPADQAIGINPCTKIVIVPFCNGYLIFHFRLKQSQTIDKPKSLEPAFFNMRNEKGS